MMKCRNLYFVQNKPKSNADRAHHVAQCLSSYEKYLSVKSMMLLLQSPGCHIPLFAFWRASSITDPTQACDTSYSCQITSHTIYLFLPTCLVVPADTESLGCVFQTQPPKPVRQALAGSKARCGFLLPDGHLSHRASKTPSRKQP